MYNLVIKGEVFTSSFSIQVSGKETDVYRWYLDEKYKKFLADHNFRHCEKVFTLYLDLCVAGLL